MEIASFDYASLRAAKARLGVRLSGVMQRLLPVTSWLLLASGVALIYFGISIGWLIMGLAAIPAMLASWFRYDLRHLDSGTNSSVGALLSGDILGRLPKQPTPLDAVHAVARVNSGLFMAARFGLSLPLLEQLASSGQMTIERIWQEAEEVRKAAGVKHYSGSVLVAAIVRSFPNYQAVIATINLDPDDLIAGVRWHEHIRVVIAEHDRPRRSGGIARDWSFGYVPLLTRFAVNISRQVQNGVLTVDTASHIAAVDQLLATFSEGGRQNAVLVGEAGVGKTTIIDAFAERLLDANANLPDSLKFRQVFLLDSSALISAAPGRGELEGLVMRILGEAYSAKNIILCLDNAQLFFEEGIGSVDLTNVLVPILEAGNLRVILSADEQKFLQISRRNASLVSALNRVNVPPSDQAETMLVMEDQVMLTEIKRKVTYTYQALKETYRLSQRYIHDLAMPGRAIKLLETAAGYAENGLVTMNSVQQAIERTMDVKVAVASTTDDREKLLNMEAHIHERMINQTRAVQVVSDALRRARTGVRNQNRPIGTFLFLGPTGVGKTELSKALADVYFGGEDRMVRLDLNEFVRPDDVTRIIADGADDPNSLTARIMKQPFSVVLLDEIEKAAPQVLATLLQLLDEGVLRDIKNREVSFRDAIVIATSNAGADRIREYIERGYNVGQFERQFVDELIQTNQFRPEFLNRFDEIVTFTPLTKDDLVKVVDLILAGVNKTLEPQKIVVRVSDDAKLVLVERGYDPRLGARPMRRIVQKTVENTVAKAMLAGSLSTGGEITIDKLQVEQMLGE